MAATTIEVYGYTRWGSEATAAYTVPEGDLVRLEASDATSIETWLEMYALDFWKVLDYRVANGVTLIPWSRPELLDPFEAAS